MCLGEIQNRGRDTKQRGEGVENSEVYKNHELKMKMDKKNSKNEKILKIFE